MGRSVAPLGRAGHHAAVEIRDTRYAVTDDGVFLAYQVTGEGPLDLVWEPNFFADVDLHWETPDLGPWLRELSTIGRLISHDPRGIGLSSRNVPPPNLETRMADLRVVLDTIGCDRPVLAGIGNGGAAMMLLAATEPERVRSLIWLSPSPRTAWAPDYPWGAGPEYQAAEENAFELWGTKEFGPAFARTEEVVGGHVDEDEQAWTAVVARHTATPDVARELSRIWWETDIRAVLPTVQVPALFIVPEVDSDEAAYTASLMPDAQVRVFPGGWLRLEDYPAYADAIRGFIGVERPHPELDTVLATVLFTDIVDSTQTQSRLGDHAWKELLERHHAVVRGALARWHGTESDTAGDGFYATFEGPARAIRCAQEIARDVGSLGLEVRAGVHTGECEVIDGKYGGLAVTIGSRISAQAQASEVLISQTVKDLVAGSGLAFEDAGEHDLKGVPDRWHLYRVGM